MKFTYLFDTFVAQDGAIYRDELFRFDAFGNCRVYSLSGKKETARFRLPRLDEWKPHCNAVCFGTDMYDENDEFPLLYTNIYNNYSKCPDRREGILCVYRIKREGDGFSAELIGVISIGFTEDTSLWKSIEGTGDVRPYGNFVIDREKKKLYAFVMRDKEQITRYFVFDIPKITDGKMQNGIYYITLEEKDIIDRFDTPYTRYMQGACAKDGIIYAVEGFAPGENPARMQSIDMEKKSVVLDVMLEHFGLPNEPEFIETRGEELYYSDATGKLYRVDF